MNPAWTKALTRGVMKSPDERGGGGGGGDRERKGKMKLGIVAWFFDNVGDSEE